MIVPASEKRKLEIKFYLIGAEEASSELHNFNCL